MKIFIFSAIFANLFLAQAQAQTSPFWVDRQPVVRIHKGHNGESTTTVFLMARVDSGFELVENSYPFRQSILRLDGAALAKQVASGELVPLQKLALDQTPVALIVHASSRGYLQSVLEAWSSANGAYEVMHMSSVGLPDDAIITKNPGPAAHEIIRVPKDESPSDAAAAEGYRLALGEGALPRHSGDLIQLAPTTDAASLLKNLKTSPAMQAILCQASFAGK